MKLHTRISLRRLPACLRTAAIAMIVAACAVAATAAAAQESTPDSFPDPQQVRQAAVRGLRFVEKDGVAWIKNRKRKRREDAKRRRSEGVTQYNECRYDGVRRPAA